MVEVIAFSTAVLVSLILTPMMINLAHTFNIIDIPQGQLKTHKIPTPYLGGVAVYIALTTSSVMFLGMSSWLALFLAGTGFLCITGLVDDIYTLTPATKFTLQSAGCVTLLISLTAITGITPTLPMLTASLFFLLTLVNAINLVDIMDALASTIAFVAMLGFIGLGILGNNPAMVMLGLPVAGALLGFMWYNRKPARIYLGDAGSLLIGGILGFFALLYGWGPTLEPQFFLAPCIAGIALIEVVYLIIIRTTKRLPVYLGSPHHFAIYLKKLGWSWETIIGFVAFAGLILNAFVLACAAGIICMPQLFIFLGLGLIPWTLIIYRTSP